jgi:hypothetical protein
VGVGLAARIAGNCGGICVKRIFSPGKTYLITKQQRKCCVNSGTISEGGLVIEGFAAVTDAGLAVPRQIAGWQYQMFKLPRGTCTSSVLILDAPDHVGWCQGVAEWSSTFHS